MNNAHSKHIESKANGVAKPSGFPLWLRAMAFIAVLLAGPYLAVKLGIWQPNGTQGDAYDFTADSHELPVINPVKPFSMVNQQGEIVDRDSLLGKVWLGAVIFTRCPGPCSTMTSRMADLQNSIPPDWPVQFVSITADSDYDNPEILDQYATAFQADPKRWHFLHASKEQMVELVTDSLKLVVLDKEQERMSPTDLFIHSTTLALVDRQGRLRGVAELVPPVIEEYPEATQDWDKDLKPRVLRAIERLLNE